MDPQTKAEFEKLLSMPTNKTCIDCEAFNPQWASVNNGVFMCIKCAGTHRSLGVHITFVRSVTMDSWSPIQLSRMKCGGNGPLRQFWKDQKFPQDLTPKEKYDNDAMEMYRTNLLSKAKGESPRPIGFIGYKARPIISSSSMSNLSNSDMNNNKNNISKTSFSNVGFGSDDNDNDNNNNNNQSQYGDVLNDLSSWASFLTQKSTEVASNLAQQSKQVASTLTVKATESAKTISEKLQNENLQEKVTQSASQGWTTVSSWLATAQKQVQTLAQADNDEPLRLYNRDNNTHDNNDEKLNNRFSSAHISSDSYFSNQNNKNDINKRSHDINNDNKDNSEPKQKQFPSSPSSPSSLSSPSNRSNNNTNSPSKKKASNEHNKLNDTSFDGWGFDDHTTDTNTNTNNNTNTNTNNNTKTNNNTNDNVNTNANANANTNNNNNNNNNNDNNEIEWGF